MISTILGAFRVGEIRSKVLFTAAVLALYRLGTHIPAPGINSAADLKGNRTLFLQHRMYRAVPLHNATKELVLAHVERLWGHDVVLEEVAEG